MPSPNAAMEDVDAYSDSGSTISLASCGSAGNDFSPRPPRAGSARTKSVKGRRSKTSNTTHSPYASSQHLQTRRIESTKPSARNMWMSAMKNGTGALSTNNKGMNTWAGTRPAHANKKRPGSRTRNFSDIVDLTDGKGKSFSKSATMSYSEPQITMGGLALKPAEDYYDEIIDLKKIINLLKEENNKVNTKLHRVEQENVMKDRHIEDLLNNRKQPEDLRRTLTDKRGDSSSMVTSLKQKLHAVERTVKEKETELNKIKRDLKTTDVEELKIQSEIYYQEIQRLQLALLQMQQDRMNELYADDDLTSSRMDTRTMNVSEQKLAKDIEILKSENKNLKRELISAVESQSSSDNKKSLNVEYADMNRGQLLHTIHQLEMRVEESESKTSNLLKEKGDLGDKKNLKKKKKDRNGSTASIQSTLDDKEADLQEENEKQREIIEKLKEDRTHYRLVADELRKELKTKESELEELQNQLSLSKTGAGGIAVPATRKPSVVSSSSQYSPRKESITAKERDEMMEREFKEFQERHAAKVLQKQWRTYKGNKTERVIRDEAQEKAAKTLQREWRKHLNQKDLAIENEAITDIQAAFRGHLTRRDMLNNMDDDDWMDSDDAIVNVQSAFRGHLTRTRHHEEPEDDQWSRNILSDNRNGELSASEDSDDDIVVGRPSSHSSQRKASPRSTDKSPFSARKRSSFTEISGKPEQGHPRPAPRTKPHPSPRTHKPATSSPTLHTPPHPSTPPSPTPCHKQPTVTVENVDDDDSDDDVVICSPIHSRKESSKSNVAVTTAKAGKDDLDDDDVFYPETESDSDNDLVVCGKPHKPKQQQRISSVNDNQKSQIVKAEKCNSGRIMGKSTQSVLDEKKQAKGLALGVFNSENVNNVFAEFSSAVAMEMEKPRAFQQETQTSSKVKVKEIISKRDKLIESSKFLAEESRPLSLKSNAEKQTGRSREITEIDAEHSEIKAISTHAVKKSGNFKCEMRNSEDKTKELAGAVGKTKVNRLSSELSKKTEEFLPSEKNITDRIDDKFLTRKSSRPNEISDEKTLGFPTMPLISSNELTAKEQTNHIFPTNSTKSIYVTKTSPSSNQSTKSTNEVPSNILTNRGVDTHMATTSESTNKSLLAKLPNEISSKVQTNDDADSNTASSTASSFGSSATKIANEKSSSISSKTSSSTSKSTSKSSSLHTKPTSSTSKSSSSINRVDSSKSNTCSPTSKTSSDALSNENPYIGLTNGSPGMSGNRYFRGMEWGKTDTSSRHKKKQEKDASRELKITRNSKKGESVSDHKSCDKLLGTENNSNNASIQDEKILQDVKKESVANENAIVKSSRTDSNNNKSGLEHDIFTQSDTKEYTIADQTFNDKSLGKSRDQFGSSAEQANLKDDQPASKSHDKYDISGIKEPRDCSSQNRSETSQSQATAQAQSKNVKPVPKPRSRSRTNEPETHDQGNGLTRQINPQRTIEEAPEDSDDDIIISNRSRHKPSTSRQVSTSREKPTKASRFEIVDSDDDDDDDDLVTPMKSTTKTDRVSTTRKKDMSRDEMNVKKNKSSSKVSSKKGREILESEDDSEDDVVVTPSKSNRLGSKGSSSKYSKPPAPKRSSLVDSLLAPKPRSSEDNRGRRLIQDDDDDDDDDDDIVLSSFSRKTSKKNSSSKKKDSLASLWSDPQPKKKSSFGFSSFEDSFSSKKRDTSSLDELF